MSELAMLMKERALWHLHHRENNLNRRRSSRPVVVVAANAVLKETPIKNYSNLLTMEQLMQQHYRPPNSNISCPYRKSSKRHYEIAIKLFGLIPIFCEMEMYFPTHIHLMWSDLFFCRSQVWVHVSYSMLLKTKKTRTGLKQISMEVLHSRLSLVS